MRADGRAPARYDRAGAIADLQDAIEASEGRLQRRPAEDPALVLRLVAWGVAVRARFERIGDPVDLDRAGMLYEQALRATDATQP
jgi:hypothetical protein